MRNPSELKVFGQADELAIVVYRLTTLFPRDERYGLIQQLRRSAVSIGSNIAEGCSRESQADFRRFIEIATGSAMELRYQLTFAYRLDNGKVIEGFNISKSAWKTAIDETESLVRALIAFSKTLRA